MINKDGGKGIFTKEDEEVRVTTAIQQHAEFNVVL